MTSTHIEHPEDLILTGDLSVLDTLYGTGTISMKMDGTSLVWGTNPQNGKFFVCTKAAFNKKKIRLCYNTDDIYRHFGHQESLAEVLTHCLNYLPRTENIYWGDFLGFGGTDCLQSNTISYVFPEEIDELLVIAPHTIVDVNDEFHNADCQPLNDCLCDTPYVKWVQPSVDRVYASVRAPKVNSGAIPFLSAKEAQIAKQKINSCIAEGHELDDSLLTVILGSVQLANLYQLVIEIKEDLMSSFIIHDAPKSFIFDDVEIDGEGFVFYSDDYGAVKLVDRSLFSYANFATSRFR